MGIAHGESLGLGHSRVHDRVVYIVHTLHGTHSARHIYFVNVGPARPPAAAAQPWPVGVRRAAAATLQAGVSDVRTRKSV